MLTPSVTTPYMNIYLLICLHMWLRWYKLTIIWKWVGLHCLSQFSCNMPPHCGFLTISNMKTQRKIHSIPYVANTILIAQKVILNWEPNHAQVGTYPSTQGILVCLGLQTHVSHMQGVSTHQSVCHGMHSHSQVAVQVCTRCALVVFACGHVSIHKWVRSWLFSGNSFTNLLGDTKVVPYGL